MIKRIGNYRILKEIGSGGMAVVYKGTQESLDRVVAIKALRTSVASEEDSVTRFEREATTLASFQHENIITVYDFFPKGGSMFIIMEYVEGIDLYDLLERCTTLPVDITAIVALQVARALDYAHFRGLIHRDVKPANIILSKLGTVKLTDFGIAKIEQSDLTRTGIGLGTPAYMSPEQVLGKRLDQQSDIFSLGIVMYQAVTGQKPFEEDSEYSILEKIRSYTPPAPRSINPLVSKDLERIILRCMEKDPEDRFSSTQELVVTLEHYLAVHVNQNYRAQMVLYLQQMGVLTEQDAKSTLHPALIGKIKGKTTPIRFHRKPPWHLLMALMTAASLITLGIILASPDRSSKPAPPPLCPPVSRPLKSPDGHLRVVAHPWAQVEIDGKVAAVTPISKPLALPPGKHQVRLINPYFMTEERQVLIKPEEVFQLAVVLKRSVDKAGKEP